MADEDGTAAGTDIWDGTSRLAGDLDASLQATARGFSRALVTGMKSAVSEGAKLESVLRSAATQITGQLLTAGLQPLARLTTATLGSALSTLVTAQDGTVISAGRVRPFASGGVVAAPTYFPMRGGTGLMGEAGPEAILPLARGADGRLGVRSGGSATGGGMAVTFNIATPDTDGFRRSEARLTAMVARAVGRGRRGL